MEKRGRKKGGLHRPFSLVGISGRRKKEGDVALAFRAPVRLHRDN